MSQEQTKRARFDATAISPADAETTPMGTAKETIKRAVELLQPKLATILSRLGTDVLVALHKTHAKKTAAEKLGDENSKVPISARFKFALRGSKLVEGDADYNSLISDSTDLVDNFQTSLKGIITSATGLEAKKLEAVAVDTLALNLRMAVKAILLCDAHDKSVNVDKFVHTLLHLHPELVTHVGNDCNSFLTTYKRVHTLDIIDAPFITEMPAL